MITVKRLREMLAELPDDARCMAYEGLPYTGETDAIIIHHDDGRCWGIDARGSYGPPWDTTEDPQRPDWPKPTTLADFKPSGR
jgi:hypothetical protein